VWADSRELFGGVARANKKQAAYFLAAWFGNSSGEEGKV
jgi:hypothetical protein